MEEAVKLIEELVKMLLDMQKQNCEKDGRIASALAYAEDTLIPNPERIRELLTGEKRQDKEGEPQ